MGAVKSYEDTDSYSAYGDGDFPLSMKGMDGGCSAHKRLMMLLAKRVRIVLTNEYRTTKGCPKCANKEFSMKCPKKNSEYFHRGRNKNYKKQIHGLSFCCGCKKLFARDYIASMNICRSFVSYFNTGGAVDYLSRKKIRPECACHSSCCLIKLNILGSIE